MKPISSFVMPQDKNLKAYYLLLTALFRAISSSPLKVPSTVIQFSSGTQSYGGEATAKTTTASSAPMTVSSMETIAITCANYGRQPTSTSYLDKTYTSIRSLHSAPSGLLKYLNH